MDGNLAMQFKVGVCMCAHACMRMCVCECASLESSDKSKLILVLAVVQIMLSGNCGVLSGISLQGCYVSDQHSATVYSQLQVFIPAGWDYAPVFRPKCSPEHLDQGAFKGRTHLLLPAQQLWGDSQKPVVSPE